MDDAAMTEITDLLQQVNAKIVEVLPYSEARQHAVVALGRCRSMIAAAFEPDPAAQLAAMRAAVPPARHEGDQS